MGSSSSKATHDPMGPMVISTQPGASPSRRQTGQNNNKDTPINNNNVVNRGGKNPVDSTPTNTLFEEVFLITLGIAVDADLPDFCVHVKETYAKYQKEPMLTTENIEESVLERTLMVNPRVHLLKSKSTKSASNTDKSGLNSHEKMTIRYLYQSFLRLKQCQDNSKYAAMKDELQKCKEVIFLHCRTCLSSPNNYKQQSVHNQFIDLCSEHADFLQKADQHINMFILGTIEAFDGEDNAYESCKKAFNPILVTLHTRFAKEYTLKHPEINPSLRVVEMFTVHRLLAEVFMSYNTPKDATNQRRYEHTLIGAVLSLSSCPKRASGPFEFFKEPLNLTQQEINTAQLYIWQQLGVICEGIFRTLIGIVKINEDLRHSVLHWFGCCLETLRGKPELWSAHEVEVFDQTFCSDGFCLNLCVVLLYFCMPFAEPDNLKLTRIKQSYCKARPKLEEEEKEFGVHARGLQNEECLVPSTSETKQIQRPEKPFPFISECFFLTQQALYVGYSSIHKMIKLNNNVNRLDKLYNDMKDVYPKKFTEMIRAQLNIELCWYLNIKAGMAEYHLTKMCLQFHTASASWLAQVAVQGTVNTIEEIRFPLPEEVPEALSQVPEMVIINISNFISTLLLFRNVEFLKSKPDNFKHLLTMIIIYMGSPKRLKNPNIRAELAETLEVVLPKFNPDGSWDITPRDEAMFKEHPLIEHLAETVLNVFVTIEMTGQNVDAEKKFNYRKSMHRTLQFMWKVPLHRMAIKQLADDAMKRIDEPDPPLFLRFINLLVNDSIFLLDDALEHMKQIKEQELERDCGDWTKLSTEQLRDKETSLRYLSMIGKHRNIMSNYTIYTLEIITRDIRDIFCHPVMVDRIASMLNYFFLYLVGPKQKDYKVRDRKELEFKPEQVVSDIAHMYLYLGKNDNFCKAVIGETRSFSHEVFQRAVLVLRKIGLIPEFTAKFEEFCKNLEVLGVDQKKEEELMADAPDEFLDPIMGTLMTDPVILPTSNKTLDKEVIRRHLLSDQCDPYNRQPLTFDMVVPNIELKERINKWLEDQRNSA